MVPGAGDGPGITRKLRYTVKTSSELGVGHCSYARVSCSLGLHVQGEVSTFTPLGRHFFRVFDRSCLCLFAFVVVYLSSVAVDLAQIACLLQSEYISNSCTVDRHQTRALQC